MITFIKPILLHHLRCDLRNDKGSIIVKFHLKLVALFYAIYIKIDESRDTQSYVQDVGQLYIRFTTCI